jgi:hypothetical protein
MIFLTAVCFRHFGKDLEFESSSALCPPEGNPNYLIDKRFSAWMGCRCMILVYRLWEGHITHVLYLAWLSLARLYLA